MSYLFEQIKQIFETLPKKAILKIAADVRRKGHHNARQKEGEGEHGWVTEADHLIEKLILDYFQNSALAGSYSVRSEEEGGGAPPELPEWQLLLDPIDGTWPYRKGEKLWGVMVGAADLAGRIFYSWNLLSTGEIYSTGDALRGKEKRADERLIIDVCDYSQGASESFPVEFCRMFTLSPEKIIVSSLPAAVWVGGEFWNGNLDGMLWLPSHAGKKFYPAHDLIFLGALKSAGFAIRLGTIEGNNAMLAVAKEAELCDRLWSCGMEMIAMEFSENLIELSDPSCICPALG